MGAEGVVTVLILGFVGFILFCIYFIFKQLQFVLVSVNLYKKIVHRQDAMVKLLLDIRDQTKKFKQSSISPDFIEASEEIETSDSEPEEGQAPFCYHCGAEISENTVKCSSCGNKI